MAHLDKTGRFELLRKGRSVGRRELLENSDIGARERSEVLLDARHLRRAKAPVRVTIFLFTEEQNTLMGKQQLGWWTRQAAKIWFSCQQWGEKDTRVRSL